MNHTILLCDEDGPDPKWVLDQLRAAFPGVIAYNPSDLVSRLPQAGECQDKQPVELAVVDEIFSNYSEEQYYDPAVQISKLSAGFSNKRIFIITPYSQHTRDQNRSELPHSQPHDRHSKLSNDDSNPINQISAYFSSLQKLGLASHIELYTPERESIILPAPPTDFIIKLPSLVSQVADRTKQLADLEWKQFEDLISEILDEYGWAVTPMGYTKDDGIDIVALRNVDPGIPVRMMVQCKRNSTNRPVGVSVVREVWSVKSEYMFHQAMIATTSTFTKGARDKAEKWQLDLRDAEAIMDWCSKLKSG